MTLALLSVHQKFCSDGIAAPKLREFAHRRDYEVRVTCFHTSKCKADLCRQKKAWGVFDKNGVKDEIGTLNHLTPEAIQNAVKEVKLGKSISLNWGLEKIHKPGFNRTSLQHKFVNWREKKDYPFYSYDDEITVNTQAGERSFITSESWNTEREQGVNGTAFVCDLASSETSG